LSLNYPVVVLLMVLGIYCILSKRNLIKIIIGLSIMTDGVHLLLISLGYRVDGIAPIVPRAMLENFSEIAEVAVDPVPQALVLTSIVINVCILALALSLTIHTFRNYGTINPYKINDLKE